MAYRWYARTKGRIRTDATAVPYRIRTVRRISQYEYGTEEGVQQGMECGTATGCRSMARTVPMNRPPVETDVLFWKGGHAGMQIRSYCANGTVVLCHSDLRTESVVRPYCAHCTAVLCLRGYRTL